jgi:hypothetical protein
LSPPDQLNIVLFVDLLNAMPNIVRTQMGQELNEHARAKGLLEFRDVPENNLETLKKVSMNKKRMAIKNLTEKSGSPHDLSFLNRNDPVFSSLSLPGLFKQRR